MSGLPATLDAAARAAADGGAIFRAGGTDLTETRRYGASPGEIVDLSAVAGLRGIEWAADGGVRIGAMTTMAALIADPSIGTGYPGLAQATAQIAAPHIREVGTVGGNLLQSTRCWYFRNHAYRCFKKGGDGCPAREGNNLLGVCFDIGPCVAPHPSTLGMTLLAHDAEVDFHGPAAAGSMSIADLYGDGTDPSRDHLLPPGTILTAVRIPPPLADDRSTYVRANARAVAEWPLAEVLVRRAADASFARVAIGGVANIPLRLGSLERLLVEAPDDTERLERAVDTVIEAATPMPMARFKLHVLRGALLDALNGSDGLSFR